MQSVKITKIKSTIGCIEPHRRTIQALGLRKIGHSVVKPMSPSLAGMLRTVEYLVKVERV